MQIIIVRILLRHFSALKVQAVNFIFLFILFIIAILFAGADSISARDII